jgi:hypothetical protein
MRISTAKHLSLGFTVALFSLLLSMLTATAVMAKTEHCPDHNGNPNKVENGNLNGVVLESGTVFCVKASNEATGLLTSDGATTLREYAADNGIDHDVSYYVTYDADKTPPNGTGTPLVPDTAMSATNSSNPAILLGLLTLAAASLIFMRTVAFKRG